MGLDEGLVLVTSRTLHFLCENQTTLHMIVVTNKGFLVTVIWLILQQSSFHEDQIYSIFILHGNGTGVKWKVYM